MRVLQRFCFCIIAMTISMISCAQSNYTFDKNHTYVLWSVDHFGYSDVTGKIFAEGTLQYDEKNPEKSTFTITVNMNTISTGLPEFDQKLKGRNFFDAEKYPTATLTDTKISRTGDKSATIDANLNIKGISKPIKLNVTLRKSDIHPFYKRPAIGFIATAKLNRGDFGIRAYEPGVSSEVLIEIHAEAIQDKPKES